MYDPEKILKIAKAFGVAGVKGIRVLSDGLMHKTYKIQTVTGPHVLQQLHPLLSSDGVIHDFTNVTEHLRAKGFFAPLCLRTASGDVMHRDETNVYRMYTFIPGQTINVAKDAMQVREAGKIVGRFHQAMADFTKEFDSTLVLHNTTAVVADLEKALQEFGGHDLMTAEVSGVGGFLAQSIPSLYLPESLPRRTVHGDLKISNILFDDSNVAVSLIDFDTCNRMTLPIEMGDAFRSWCGDDEDRLDNVFSLSRFKEGWGGYSEEVASFIDPEEKKYIVQGIMLITLELSARFLTDYFRDSYFGWNNDRYNSRREHNLARMRGQVALYRNLLEKRDQAEKIVTES